MKKMPISLGTLLLLGLAAVGVGQEAVRPPPPDATTKSSRDRQTPQTAEQIAKAKKEIAEAYRYKGTTAVLDRRFRGDDLKVKKVCELLSQADFIPALRLERFSEVPPRFTVVGWRVTVEKLEVRKNDTLVRVRSAPLLLAPGHGTIGVATAYREYYRVVKGKLYLVDGDPIPEDKTISISGQ